MLRRRSQVACERIPALLAWSWCRGSRAYHRHAAGIVGDVLVLALADKLLQVGHELPLPASSVRSVDALRVEGKSFCNRCDSEARKHATRFGVVIAANPANAVVAGQLVEIT